MFISKLSGPPIGLSALSIFTIDAQSVMIVSIGATNTLHNDHSNNVFAVLFVFLKDVVAGAVDAVDIDPAIGLDTGNCPVFIATEALSGMVTRGKLLVNGDCFLASVVAILTVSLVLETGSVLLAILLPFKAT